MTTQMPRTPRCQRCASELSTWNECELCEMALALEGMVDVVCQFSALRARFARQLKAAKRRLASYRKKYPSIAEAPPE